MSKRVDVRKLIFMKKRFSWGINSNKGYKRISFGTKNKYLAEQIYNAY